MASRWAVQRGEGERLHQKGKVKKGTGERKGERGEISTLT